MKPTYRGTVSDWDGRYWVIFVDIGEEWPVGTQARTIGDVDMMAREAVSIRLEVPEDSFDLDISVDSPLADDLEALAEASRCAEAAVEAERRARRAVAHRARDLGLTLRDTASLMGLSHQRIAQLLQESPEPSPT